MRTLANENVHTGYMVAWDGRGSAGGPCAARVCTDRVGALLRRGHVGGKLHGRGTEEQHQNTVQAPWRTARDRSPPAMQRRGGRLSSRPSPRSPLPRPPPRHGGRVQGRVILPRTGWWTRQLAPVPDTGDGGAHPILLPALYDLVAHLTRGVPPQCHLAHGGRAAVGRAARSNSPGELSWKPPRCGTQPPGATAGNCWAWRASTRHEDAGIG